MLVRRTTRDTRWRSTMGVCLGLRGGIATACVVLSWKRDDKKRLLYVVHEREWDAIDVDSIADGLQFANELYHPAMTVGYHGGRDDEEVFKVLSVRLGQHVDPAPGDAIAPTQLLVDDFRRGRLKARADSLVARDAKQALWRNGVPDQTGILAALRCAHWAAMKFAPRPTLKPLTGEEKTARMARERRERMEKPY